MTDIGYPSQFVRRIIDLVSVFSETGPPTGFDDAVQLVLSRDSAVRMHARNEALEDAAEACEVLAKDYASKDQADDVTHDLHLGYALSATECAELVRRLRVG